MKYEPTELCKDCSDYYPDANWGDGWRGEYPCGPTCRGLAFSKCHQWNELVKQLRAELSQFALNSEEGQK